ncbi:hypothetical protein SH528x_002969 [Novipirellula sp. SH528]|uniref:hypothetical protein n=1 Tax=Novipirellula sp. SH528 TaxID=3454466 RepID=UPI003FA151B9
MPTVFQAGNHELIAFVRDPSAETLLDYFKARTGEWIESFICCETFTVDTFYDFRKLQNIDPSVAYDIIDNLRSFATDQLPDKTLLRWMDLLAALADHADIGDPPRWLSELAASAILALKRSEPQDLKLASWAHWANDACG